jgi:hypothetical protein
MLDGGFADETAAYILYLEVCFGGNALVSVKNQTALGLSLVNHHVSELALS